MSDPGLSPDGFTVARQTDIIDGINTSLQSSFGSSINLSSKSVFGNLVGVFSEPLALVWEALESVYNSQFSGGAEGAAVDNILELDDLSRLPGQKTTTAPNSVPADDGTFLNGFIVRGDPGTVVTAASLVQSTTVPAASVTVDADITIDSGENAEQEIDFNTVPISGFFGLSLAYGGGVLTTSAISAPVTASAIQAAIVALTASDSTQPFTDVQVQSEVGTQYLVSFGVNTPVSGQPSSGAQYQPPITFSANMLEGAGGAVSATIVVDNAGDAPKGLGSATCTTTGPTIIPANTLTAIATPIAGWTSVNNDIDCIIGSNDESDTDALARRQRLFSGTGAAKLSAIKARVSQVAGVSPGVVGFENRSNCALQNMQVPYPTPTSGNYRLQLGGGITSDISPAATARQIQDAINALSGYNVVVTGGAAYGFQVDFNGSFGGAAQPLLLVVPGSAMPTPDINVTFGRPPNSFEIIVLGGADADIRQAILDSAPTGIASYGAPAFIYNGSRSTNEILTSDIPFGVTPGMYVRGAGILNGTVVTTVNPGGVFLSQATVADSAVTAYLFTHEGVVFDEDGVGHIVGFTRASVALQYIAVLLLTDYYLSPGDATSGRNPYATFDPASIAAVKSELVAIGSKVKPGGLIITKGYGGLVGAFNDIPGVLDYAMALNAGSAPALPGIDDPMPDNQQLLSAQFSVFEVGNVAVQWT